MGFLLLLFVYIIQLLTCENQVIGRRGFYLFRMINCGMILCANKMTFLTIQATFEGWMEIMRDAVDSQEVKRQVELF